MQMEMAASQGAATSCQLTHEGSKMRVTVQDLACIFNLQRFPASAQRHTAIGNI